MNKLLFTSESVSEGHPDKICDQISDAILDSCLKQDPNTRLSCEVYITSGYVLIGGEIKTLAKVDYKAIARKVLLNIGYVNNDIGIDGRICRIEVLIHSQSPDIVQGVEVNNHLAAGDQGIVFGYASSETKNYMPLGVEIAHDLVRVATNLRKNYSFKFARPDMKSQVTIDYSDKKPKIHTILMSIQHNPFSNFKDEKEFKKFIIENIMQKVAKKYNLNSDFKVLINPTGRFVIGGPDGDTGLTGRKIVVDSYGGYAHNGGGAFSGKDATKVDRTAAYMARKVAKHIVAIGWAKECEIQLAYAIGLEQPVSISLNTFNTEKINFNSIFQIIQNVFDFSIQGMIDTLDLTKPIFQKTAVYGHFGKGEEFSWERLDYLEKLQNYYNKNYCNKLKKNAY